MKIENLKTLLINLPECVERLELSLEELKSLNIEDVKIIPGVVHKNPMIGIASAHLNAIKLAKDNKWKAVIVCEDDVKITSKQSREYLDLALENAPKDFDILLGCVYYSKDIEKVNEYWSKSSDWCSLVFYIVNEKCYDKLLEFDYSMHIDRYIASRKDINSYFCNKFPIIQYDGWSYNIKADTNYNNDLLKKFNILE